MTLSGARPKNGRPLQNLPHPVKDGFVEAGPSRVFRDGPGILRANWVTIETARCLESTLR
jgi:hypothetical protein